MMFTSWTSLSPGPASSESKMAVKILKLLGETIPGEWQVRLFE
jgi:hypothetical protein